MKSTFKAIVLGLGLFAGATQAATFTNCDEVKEITASLVTMKLIHKDVREYAKATWAIAHTLPSKHDRYVFMGIATMVYAREQLDPARLTKAPQDYKEHCKEVGPEKIAEDFYEVGAKQAK